MYTTVKRQVIILVGALLSFVLAAQSWAATLTVSPTTVVPSGLVTVTLAGGPGTSEDCFALYSTTAAPYIPPIRYVAPATAGTYLVTMPSTAGTYLFRFYQNCATVRLLATSAIVTVGTVVVPPPPPPPPPPVSSLTVTGRSVTVAIAGGPGGLLDWMGLFAVGAPDTAYLDWARLNGTKATPATGPTTGSATFAIPLTGGPWEIRFLTSDGAGHYTRLAIVSTIALVP